MARAARSTAAGQGEIPRRSSLAGSVCPGCGLQIPGNGNAAYGGYYNASPECWALFTEVLGTEFSNALVFGQAHQITVDTYAVQHAGGSHPDKSVGVHLSGLYLVLEGGFRPPYVARLMQQLAAAMEVWPHFPPPEVPYALTILDVALAESPEAHVAVVRQWSSGVWEAWGGYHAEVAALVAHHLKLGA